ncbi:MAG TPA: GGDEF domain-containing protein [Solirubrobacteraceae bacterium]|nr:GGDEF domain-containing protein [Solirubrobacteraceae bacterium]
MLRTRRVDGDVRARRPGNGRGVAPAPLRVALIAALVGLLAGVIGGPGGFWIGLPGVILAASIGSTATGTLLCAAPVLIGDVIVASAVPGSTIPPLWLVVLVPAASVAVLHGMGTRLRRERDAMEQAAYSDPLTGLANRRLLMSVADHEIARHQRADERFTVVMLDLDGFKLLNDRFGHAAGDEMLCDVAGALKGALRSQDTVARLGGDEFCVIAPATANPRPLAEKIVGAVAHASRGHEQLRTSIGVAVFPEDGSTIELLLRTADERLLSAKRRLHGTRQRRAA